MASLRWLAVIVGLLVFPVAQRVSAQGRVLVEVPDYDWYGGCFGTASGNLMGYWDRHGLPGFYTGPTGGGLAPLDSYDRPGITNSGIRSLFTSKAGLDGRSNNVPGHVDDYWFCYSSLCFSYENTGADPYQTAGRPEHTPDCIGDFIGLSQRKWTNMNNECDGNIDAYSFVYWNLNGDRRTNFVPSTTSGTPTTDIQSGLREWTRWKGYDADVFTQLTDFNPNVSIGHGFTFTDLKAEIDAGYPVLLFLQPYNELSRSLSKPTPMPRANPDIHGMLAYGYYDDGPGNRFVYYRTSWGNSGDSHHAWDSQGWEAGLPVRGVIGYHPKPKVREVSRTNDYVTVSWDGPASQLLDTQYSVATPVHRYVLEYSPSLNRAFEVVTEPTTAHTATVTNCCDGVAFYRVRLLGR